MNTETWLLLQHSTIRSFIACFVMLACQQICMYSTHKTVGFLGFRLLITPFVFAHELSHFFMAHLMGFRYIRLEMSYKTTGRLGQVTYQYKMNAHGYIGVSITAIAPLIFGTFALYGLSSMVGFNSAFHTGLFDMHLFLSISSNILTINPFYLLFGLYLFCGICIAMSPSIQDYKTSISGILVTLTFILLVIAAGIYISERFIDWLTIASVTITNLLTISALFTCLTTLLVIIMQSTISLFGKSR